jgi:hypothetical protein
MALIGSVLRLILPTMRATRRSLANHIFSAYALPLVEKVCADNQFLLKKLLWKERW